MIRWSRKIFTLKKYAFSRTLLSQRLPETCQGSRICGLAVQTMKNYSTIGNKKVQELEIPVPFGKIAAKAWGSKNGYPVLALHGWLDNCGTFDKLMPCLLDKFYFVALDAPGHGQSSHLPSGAMYSDISMVIDYKRVSEFLGWEKFHILGHSMGGAFALLFASIFPELVHKLMLIDIVKPFSETPDLAAAIKTKGVRELVKIDKKVLKSPPLYTPEDAAARLKSGMHGEVNDEGIQILLQRGAKLSDCGKGLVFSRDLRNRPIEFISVRSHDMIEQFMLALKCELLMILATNSSPHYQPEKPETVTKYIDLYKNNLQNVVVEHVEGNHFVHLNNPERIAPIINKFLLN